MGEEKTRGIEWPDFIHPTYREKTLNAVKADSKVYRNTFDPTVANPGDVLNVHVPRLSKNMVIVPGSLALVFEIDLTGGEANNYLVQNVTRALVSRMDMKFGGTELQTTQGYGLFKLFEDLFLSKEKRDSMVLEGIQSKVLCKIRSDSGDKETSGVDDEKAQAEIYGKKYRIRLDHPILTENGVFYPEGLYSNLMFQITLAPASEVVKGSDTSKLQYKLKNIQLEYETINSPSLADETFNVYNSGKSIPYFTARRFKPLQKTRTPTSTSKWTRKGSLSKQSSSCLKTPTPPAPEIQKSSFSWISRRSKSLSMAALTCCTTVVWKRGTCGNRRIAFSVKRRANRRTWT